MDNNTLFIAECAKQKKLKGLLNKDIARLTGYNVRTVINFFSPSYSYKNEKLKKAIARVLEIEI